MNPAIGSRAAALLSRAAAIEDIPMEFPLPTFALPDHDVFRFVDHLVALGLQGGPTHFVGCVIVLLDLSGVQPDRLETHVHQSLPELLKLLPPLEEISVRWHARFRCGFRLRPLDST